MNTSLLEYLMDQVGCLYLSDLPIPQYRRQIIENLEALEPDSYPVREWNDTVSYITKKLVHFDHAQEALQYLKEFK